MKKLFIETFGFTARVSAFLSEEDYSNLQKLLMANPDMGKVMPGCGGLRKLRLADPRRRKGKRGGIRVLYLHVLEVDRIFMIDIYDKAERDDLSRNQKKLIKAIVDQCKKDAIA